MTIIYVLLGVCLLLQIVSIVLFFRSKKVGLTNRDKEDIKNALKDDVEYISKSSGELQRVNNENIMQTIRLFQENLTTNQASLEKRVYDLMRQLDERMQNISKMQEEKLSQMMLSNEKNIKSLQEDNNKQLDKMRETVDEKLSKTINERFEQSFKVLSEQLNSVYKSLGEMQNIASDVGSLTKMLSNVKTTGVFGEIQLGAILEQMLTKDQYVTNFVTGEGREPVEFAIKLPGIDDGDFVYMPIDSKFPYTVYSDLQTAYDNNDFDLVKQKKEQLKNTIRGMAKDINTKYICPPKTTNFAVMFLPVEGLYAEVAKMGLIEELQSKFNVTIAGPTTMSALLNSLQMGFRTLAIQKKSGEVWKILGAVRTEFEKFNVIVENIRKRFEGASKDFDTLIGTRSRLIARKLNTVERLDSDTSVKVLGLDDLGEGNGEE